jgi:hypothetical protein
MKNKVGNFFMAILLFYAGLRTGSYILHVTGEVGSTTSLLMAGAYILASEGAYLYWLLWGLPKSTTETQENVAQVMVFVSFVLSMVVGAGDLVRTNTLYVIDTSAFDGLLFSAPIVATSAQVLAHSIYHMADSDRLQEKAERQLKQEEAALEISARSYAVDELQANRQALGNKLSPFYIADLVDRVEGRTLKRFAAQAGKIKAKAKRQQQQDTVLFGDLLERIGSGDGSPKATR